ncbi:hypothetical protein UPYG_G00097800 [Umbra pygmaea]|uniref:RING-type E3 ubiquitin transferase n=1 Tax=Umbra pygmaea TaxID=75934 RepID=A0ABD0X072_UMBPY
MSEQGRTVRVSGLPTNLEEDRLTDKLAIHFLRSRNGGGEIASITINKAKPRSALITFEDSGVAMSVLGHGPHFLVVDGKKYRLTLSEPFKDLDPNMVILNMSITVDYSQLPEGIDAVTSLVRSHGLQVNYNQAEPHCTLAGLYPHVQAALGQLLGLPGAPPSKNTPPPVSGGSSRGRRSHTLEETDHGRRLEDEHRDRTHRASDLLSADSDPHRGVRSGGQGWEGEMTAHVEGGAVGLSQLEQLPQGEEDLSLIMDADMFLYLRSLCTREYLEILTKHRVEAVDMTADGVTTLFLQRLPGVRDTGHDMASIREARQALSQLYQENEARLRRAQLPKSILRPRGGLSRAMEGLRVRLPKLLLTEDECNVYIVGSSSDVSDAKQHLLLGEAEEAAEDVGSLLQIPSSASSSSKPGYEERLPGTLSSSAVPDTRIDRLLKGSEAERTVEGPRGYKFAPRFKALGAAGLTTRPKEAVTAADPSTSIRAAGPMLGQDVLGLERAGWGVEGVSMLEREYSGGETLLRRGDLLVNSERSPTHPNTVLGANTTSSPSGSPLKRASSFSGRVKPKVQEPGQIETEKSTSRTRRSNSLERRHVCSADVTVPTVMWNYIKEAYASRIKDMTTDLQMRERQIGTREVAVTLKGAESYVVGTWQLELQKLVAMVQTDFCVQKLTLAELGVSDPEDETLAVCCTEVRRRFRRVTIQMVKDDVFLIGPRQLCSQVGEALREVFPGEPERRWGLEDSSVPSTSSSNQPSPSQVNGDQESAQFQTESPQRNSEMPRGGEEEITNPQRRASTKTLENSKSECKNTAISQSPAKKAAVIKERVGMGGAVEADGKRHRGSFQMDTFLSHPTMDSEGRTRVVNGGSSTLPQTTAPHPGKDRVTPPNESDLRRTANLEDKDQTVRRAEDQGRSGRSLERHGPGRCSQSGGGAPICVCGASGASVCRTGCGVTLCQQCLPRVHAQCRVCTKTEVATPPQGILGNMSYSEMPLSLSSNRDIMLKITYCIPDGIQGENHPSPGSAFRGGLFEAFLPLCERTRKLLPCLERAFRSGLTFTVTGKEPGAKVTWNVIPHKTSLQGGKSGNGYPDSSYLSRLSEVLKAYGIEEAPATSEVKNKT